MTAPSTGTSAGTHQPLADAIATLAETPDDVPGMDAHLRRVAQLAAGRITAVDYAAIAPRPDDGRCTVAASGELIDDVTTALSDEPAAETVTTMDWPRFRETAADLGLHVVSVPLYTGSGEATATLDLYGSDSDTMAPLTAGISAAYDPGLPLPGERGDLRPLDAGGEELVAGVAEALSVRETIQLALSLLRQRADDAYPRLRVESAEKGVSLFTAANSIIRNRLAG